MFQGSKGGGRTMKWGTLLKDLREKVGLTNSPPSASASSSSPSPSAAAASSDALSSSTNALSALHGSYSPSRDKHELELDFKRFWEEFRSSSSEKEKEAALNLTVDVFCRLVKQHANVAQLVTLYEYSPPYLIC